MHIPSLWKPFACHPLCGVLGGGVLVFSEEGVWLCGRQGETHLKLSVVALMKARGRRAHSQGTTAIT